MEAKQAGFSDRQLAGLIGVQENDMRNERIKQGVKPWVKQVSNLLNELALLLSGMYITGSRTVPTFAAAHMFCAS